MRDLLANNQVAYRWLEVDEEPARRLLAEAALGTDRLPVVLLPGRRAARRPRPGRGRRASRPPDGGRACALRPRRRRRRAGRPRRGGLRRVRGPPHRRRRAADVRRPGGREFADRELPRLSRRPLRCRPRAPCDRRRHAVSAPSCSRRRRPSASTSSAAHAASCGSRPAPTIASHTVLLAPGVSYRRLDAKGADRLTGRGIWYGTASAGDAALLDGQEAFVIGGANSAGQAALHLASGANVTILYRGDSLRKSMSQYLVDRIEEMPEEITVRLNTRVVETHGEEALESITIDEDGSSVAAIPATALFVFVGAEPHTEWLGTAPARSERGFILTGAQVLDLPGEMRALAAGAASARARDERPRRLRRRRRARPVDQARGLGGRRGLDGGAARPPVPERRTDLDPGRASPDHDPRRPA